MKHHIKYFYMTLFAFLFLSLTTYSQMKFEAKLTGEQEVPAVTTGASGTATFNMTAEGLEYLITINNVNMTAAHIHMGKVGVEGGVVKTLTAEFEGNSASGIWTSSDSEPLTDAMIEALIKGELYINVHSDAYPDGEIRGQIESSTSTAFSAILNGSQQVPQIETNTKGTAVFSLTAEGLKYDFTISGSNATEAEIYIGSRGTNGDLVKTIQLEGNSTVGVWTKSEAEPLTDAVIEAMLKGDVYLEVNTESNLDGEVRGQLELNGGLHLSAELSGDNVEPSVETETAGTANFTLTAHGLVYEAVCDSIDITSAAFFRGEAGVNGEILKDVSVSVEGNTIVGVWLTSDNTTELTADIMADLVEGNVYLQVGSGNNTEGELRGQVEFNSEASLNVRIENTTESSAELIGVGTFKLDNDGLDFRLSVEGRNATAFKLMSDSGEVATFNSKFNTNTFVGTWDYLDLANPFTQADFYAMLEGNVWIEIEEDTVRTGDARGHIKANADVLLSASLSSNQETNDNPSTAKGTAFIKVVGDVAVYFATVDSININAAHFHNAEIGVDGNVVKTITADFENNTAVGVWAATDAEAFTDAELEAMMKGNIYLNVHTNENPGGEIRGQATVKGGLGFYAETNGDKLITPIETDAHGTGSFTLTAKGLIYNYSAESVSIVEADIRYGSETETGPVAVSLIGDLSANTTVGVWLSNVVDGFSTSDMSALLKNETYVNVTSSLHSEGEMRGQIKPNVKDETIVGIEEQDNEELPKDLVLSQNYPNPFNPTTTIEYYIPESGFVKLDVYNILGEKIATLFNNEQTAGYHSVIFDASEFASGIYIYRLTSGDDVQSRKMQLIK